MFRLSPTELNYWTFKEVLFEDLEFNIYWGLQLDSDRFPAEQSIGIEFAGSRVIVASRGNRSDGLLQRRPVGLQKPPQRDDEPRRVSARVRLEIAGGGLA